MRSQKAHTARAFYGFKIFDFNSEALYQGKEKKRKIVTDTPANKNYVFVKQRVTTVTRRMTIKPLHARAVKIEDFKCP